MESALRTALRWHLVATAWLLTWLLSTVLRTPLPWYAPATRAWSFGGNPGGVAMDFPGRLMLALLLSGLTWLLCGPLLARLQAPALQPWLRRTLGWVVSLLVLAAGMEVHILSKRVPGPVLVRETKELP